MSEEKVEEVQEEATEEVKPPEQMFKHESFTDGDNVTVEVLTPVKISSSGKASIDKDGKKIFVGKTYISVGSRPTPYTFRIIEADNLKAAVDCFEASLQHALEGTRKEVEEFQKKQEEEQKSKILTPSQSEGGIIV